MVNLRLFLGLLLSCIVAGQSAGEPDNVTSRFDKTVQEGIDEVYNLHFENADADFRQLVALRPHDPAGPFFLAMVDWWRIVIDIDNTQYDDRFYAELDRVVDMCDSILDRNPNDVNAMFFKGGAIGFKGRLKFHRNDYLAAANAGRLALPLVQAASGLDSNNYDILLGTGMYNYFADVIPEEYPFVKPLLLFIPSGDRQKGLQELQLAAEKGKYASVETWYFLLQIYFSYEKNYQKALAIAQQLFSRFPENVIFQRYLGRCETMVGNWPAAGAVFKEVVRRARAGQRGYSPNAEREAEYYVGMSLMIERNYDAALPHFYRCDELSRELDAQEASGFMVMANLKVGNIYDIQGKRDLAIAEYQKVLGMKEYKDSHTQAEQYLKDPAKY
ncbi:MAG: tetratricopeptide repeat protein [Bacteroidota bacterium]